MRGTGDTDRGAREPRTHTHTKHDCVQARDATRTDADADAGANADAGADADADANAAGTDSEGALIPLARVSNESENAAKTQPAKDKKNVPEK